MKKTNAPYSPAYQAVVMDLSVKVSVGTDQLYCQNGKNQAVEELEGECVTSRFRGTPPHANFKSLPRPKVLKAQLGLLEDYLYTLKKPGVSSHYNYLIAELMMYHSLISAACQSPYFGESFKLKDFLIHHRLESLLRDLELSGIEIESNPVQQRLEPFERNAVDDLTMIVFLESISKTLNGSLTKLKKHSENLQLQDDEPVAARLDFLSAHLTNTINPHLVAQRKIMTSSSSSKLQLN